MPSENVALKDIIQRLWNTPENAEWTPKTDVMPLSDVMQWMQSDNIEILGFTIAMLHDGRFRIEPPLPVNEYVQFVKHYSERCFLENPDGEWSDSSYSAGWDLVRVFIELWDNETVPRELLLQLKVWLATLYKSADDRLRTCIVNATLEHLFERKLIRKYFSDWQNDPILSTAYSEACLWDRQTPLSR